MGHYAGKSDDAHEGTLGESALREASQSDPTPDAGDPGPTPDAGDPGPTPDAGNPTFGAADPTRDPDPDVDDDPDGLELPCGHETVDRSDLPELPCNVSCETCGQTWGLRE
jgi:hypothetical protein